MKPDAAELAQSLDSAYLNLIILPTEHCNLRCSYCYEDHAAGRMKPEIVAAIKKLVSARSFDLRVLEVSWFGGEPLLTPDIVKDLSAFFRDICATRGITYGANMTTNATRLDPRTLATLVELGVTVYQISLDGFGDDHDRTRHGIKGQPTFNTIYNNLIQARNTSCEFRIIIRVHYSPDNYLRLDQLVAALNRDFGADSRFSVHFKSIDRLGGLANTDIRLFDREEKERIRAELVKSLAPQKLFPLNSNGICYATRANSLLIYPSGELGKCTVALHEPYNIVGRLEPDGSVVVDQPRFRRWLSGLFNGDPQWLSCPWQPLRDARAEETLLKRRLPVLI